MDQGTAELRGLPGENPQPLGRARYRVKINSPFSQIIWVQGVTDEIEHFNGFP